MLHRRICTKRGTTVDKASTGACGEDEGDQYDGRHVRALRLMYQHHDDVIS